MAKIALDSGLGRESLYKALNSEAKPRFETVLKVLNSLGVTISISPIHDKIKAREKPARLTKKYAKIKAYPSRLSTSVPRYAGQKKA